MPNCPVCKKPRVMQVTLDKYGKCSECNNKKKAPTDNAVINADTNPPVDVYKKKSIPSVLREQVWRNYFKNSLDGLCPICANKISFANHDCAHILAEAQGGSTCINNLRPTCGKCNKSMGTTHLDEFKSKINPNAVTHAKRVDPKYLIFWSEISAVYDYYDKWEWDEEEKKMFEDSGTIFIWEVIQEIFIVLLEKLNNNPNDPILKHSYSTMFVEYLFSHVSLRNAVKYAPKTYKLQELINNCDIEYAAYKDIIDRRYTELDKQFFKFKEIKLAKRIAENIKLIGALSDYPKLTKDFDYIVRIFNTISKEYMETISEYHKDRFKETITYLIKFLLILLEVHISNRITYRTTEELEYLKANKDNPAISYYIEYSNRFNTPLINYADIGTFYTLMFTDSHPYIPEECLKDILDLKNGYF